MNNEIQNILAGLGSPLTSELVSGKLCGLVCELCPLRPFKSLGMTPVSCDQILKASRPSLRKIGLLNRFKKSMLSALGGITKGLGGAI